MTGPKRTRQFFSIVMLLLLVLANASQVFAAPDAQALSPQQKASNLLNVLTPEERVGQLFLVAYKGSSVDEVSVIAKLIKESYVGGVVLESANDNFTAVDNIPAAYQQLTASLQTIGSQNTRYIPLLIGISQQGGGYPYDQILNGLNKLPSELAIAATWEPENANRVGQIAGRELSALGFNLWIGPSLDILDTPAINAPGASGVNSFGSNATWVSSFSQNYIQGVRQGSQSRMLIMPGNFPGLGSIDRNPQMEAGTVRKTLDELQASDLVPFIDSAKQRDFDGLMVSNARYQGLQGNLAELSAPISLDAQTLQQVMGLDGLKQWYEAGGILMTDKLGSQAIRRYYDPTNTAFDGRTVARNAFLAGNDLLYLSSFLEPNDPDGYTTITKTVSSFVQKYKEDRAFAERVDDSVLRILTKKYELYGNFDLGTVLPSSGQLEDVGLTQSLFLDIAREGATLINPSLAELRTILPSAPSPSEQIVIFTDERLVKQCSTCAVQSVISKDGLKASIMRLYGPGAGGQINEARITSYSFQELARYLADPTTNQALEVNLKGSHWVVFLTQGNDPAFPESVAINSLLNSHPGLIAGKKNIAFAMGTPFSLDSTDISKLTAYFALYSNSDVYLDTAARLLFQEILPGGSLPVSVPAIGYAVNQMVSPDPRQLLGLELDIPASPLEHGTQLPPQVRKFKVGEEIPLRTSVILDRNGRVVPDGTTATFSFTTAYKGEVNQQYVDAITEGGIARTVYEIPDYGSLEIKVQSGEAKNSHILTLNIIDESGAVLATVLPTPIPTATHEATPVPEITPTATIEPTRPNSEASTASGWLLTFILLAVISVLVIWFLQGAITLQWAVRLGLLSVITGFLAYLAVLAGSIDLDALMPNMGNSGLAVVIVIGAAVGLGIGLIWWVATRVFAKR